MIRKKQHSKKKKNKKIDKNIFQVMNLRKVDDDGVLITEQGYMDMIEIEGKDIFSLKDEDINRDINIFHSFLKVTGADTKIVTMKFPVNTQKQKDYVSYKIENTQNPIHRKFLEGKLLELEFLEENRSNKEHYLFIFSEKKDNLKNVKKTAIRVLQNSINIKELPLNKKEMILKKLYNQNSKIYTKGDKRIDIQKQEER